MNGAGARGPTEIPRARALSWTGRRARGAGLTLALVLAAPPALAQEAYVTAQLANEVAVVDLAAGKVTAHVAVEGAPAGIALSPDRRTAYVTRPEGQAVAVIDLDARKVVASLPLPGGPLGIAVNPVSGNVYVADWYAARVFVLTPTPHGLDRTGEIAVGKSPSGLAVTRDGRTLLVANRESDSVSVVDLAAAREAATIPVGRHPFGLTLSADGSRAYTANVVSNDVSVVDVARAREVGRVASGERPYVVALAGGHGFVTDQYSGTVSVFSLDTLERTGTIDVDDHPEGIAADRDGRTLYVANWGGNTLSVIDAQTMKVTRAVALPDGPRAFGDFVR